MDAPAQRVRKPNATVACGRDGSPRRSRAHLLGRDSDGDGWIVVHDDHFLLYAECQQLLVPRDDDGVRGVGLQGVVEGKVAAL